MGAKQKSPGPAAYTIQNTVGADTPAFSFGSMKRPSPGGNAGISPGPVYQLKTSVGRNKDLIFRHNPAFGFGTMERPDPAGASKLHRSPGPGEYKLGSVVGPVKPPAYKSAPSFGFGTSSRLPGDAPVLKRLDRTTLDKLNTTMGSHAANMGDRSGNADQHGNHDAELEATPGPGQYDGQSWRKKRPPAYSFGTSAQRPSASTRATRVPGPGKYKQGETTGDGTMLTLKKNPAFGFGTARSGTLLNPSDTPGPGSYVCASAFGKQTGTRKRNLPQFSFGTSPRETGVYD